MGGALLAWRLSIGCTGGNRRNPEVEAVPAVDFDWGRYLRGSSNGPSFASQPRGEDSLLLTRDRLGVKPQRLAADGSYGTGPFLSWLMERGVEPHVSVLERKHQTEGKLTEAPTMPRASIRTDRTPPNARPARCGKAAPADASAPSCACSTRTPATTPENCARSTLAPNMA